MIFGSVCSGIEAASVAWEPLGWKAGFFSEIEKFPNRVLAHHYPDVPNFGDMTKYKEWPDVPIDLLCGGTPCQSFSIAGLRKGLDDARGNLMLTFCDIAARYRPRWLVWENVPGVLSSNGGADFAAFLGTLTGRTVSVPRDGWKSFGVVPGISAAYGIAYRVLDAQYFGVAQRRRRVFVVGYIGDWRPAAAVLLERESLCGHPAPRREKGERVAPCVTNGPPFSRTGNERVEVEAMVTTYRWQNDKDGIVEDGVSATLRRESATTDERSVPAYVTTFDRQSSGEYGTEPIASTISARDFKGATDQICSVHGTQDPDVLQDMAHTLGRNSGQENAVCFSQNTNAGMKQTSYLRQGMAVRRLTPQECEALQGFPRNYTDVPDERGKPAADGPRYKALGNSWAVPCVQWIGERIQAVDDIMIELQSSD